MVPAVPTVACCADWSDSKDWSDKSNPFGFASYDSYPAVAFSKLRRGLGSFSVPSSWFGSPRRHWHGNSLQRWSAPRQRFNQSAPDALSSPATPTNIYSPKDYAPTLLDDQFTPIDLPSAVRLAGVQNPDLFLARQRVVEAAALRQLAAAQLLPSLNLGTNFDAHSGPLQQSNGNILNVSRSALYAGAGANAVAAGTVNIPGVVWNLNVSNSIYGILVARQVVNQRQFANLQTNNDILQEVAVAYYELLRAEGMARLILKCERKRLPLPILRRNMPRPASAVRRTPSEPQPNWPNAKPTCSKPRAR